MNEIEKRIELIKKEIELLKELECLYEKLEKNHTKQHCYPYPCPCYPIYPYVYYDNTISNNLNDYTNMSYDGQIRYKKQTI